MCWIGYLAFLHECMMQQGNLDWMTKKCFLRICLARIVSLS